MGPAFDGEHRGEAPDGPALHVLSAEGPRGQARAWTIHLHREVLNAENGERTLRLTRDEIARGAKIVLYTGASVFQPPGWKNGLKIDAVGTETFREWMTPALSAWGTRTAMAMTKGYLPSGAFVLVLWWLGTGNFALAYGVLALLTALARRVRPGPGLFLLTSVNVLFIAVILGVDIWLGLVSPWWAIGITLLLFAAGAGMRWYRFFSRPTRA